ncbi:M23 family metallopeptidase [Geomonas propionica]|uniref:M23 family metallopeptidase n=1 Tax=Geomonas propionica TaxID=2798582 RepID=A0ABS0YXD8_9BACT|nr:M23 family metallopeptidase [Geomonas propionica]MBJ6802615.1 M23 family metallopeptidase [Geomonas propionica]
MFSKRSFKIISVAILALIAIVVAGFFLPEQLMIPVRGATPADWNHNSFWFKPWGKSGVHRGIDIFAPEGRDVISACSGIVVYTNTIENGGKVVSVLGSKWRVHYYAHLKQISTVAGRFVSRGEKIGTVGTTGNAVGKPAHLHYAIITQIPYPWLYRSERFGIDRMSYLNPHELLMKGR